MLHGVQTSGVVELRTVTVLGQNVEHGYRYEAASSRGVRNALRSLNLDYRQYTFVDFGSGKGRALLVASSFPFRSVVGIEFAAELHSQALRNVRSYRLGRVRCRSVECVHADAADFALPVGPLVLFFFNPFGEPVMTSVVCNIQRSLQAHPRDALIVCIGSLMRTEIIDRMDNIRVLSRDKNVIVSRIEPGAKGAAVGNVE